MDKISRFRYIDSIRAIAAILVVIQHTSEVFITITDKGTYLANIVDYFDFGRMGVIIFFCVSGFVIPSSLKGEHLLGIKCFIIKRFFRLYPAFWISLPLGWYTSWYIWGKEINISTVLANITMVPNIFDSPEIQGLYWTLQTEIFFYILCICLFLFNKLNDFKYLVIISVFFLLMYMILLLYTYDIRIFYHIGIMFWGSIFRKYIGENKNYIIKYSLGFIFIIIVGIIPLALYQYTLCDFGKIIGGYSLSMALFILLTLIIKINNVKIAYIGEISYSIYLFHPIVFYPIYKLAGYYSWIYNYHLIVYIIISVVLTIILSIIMYEKIEKRYIDKSRRICNLIVEK